MRHPIAWRGAEMGRLPGFGLDARPRSGGMRSARELARPPMPHSDGPAHEPADFSIFAHESFSETVRLKTGLPGLLKKGSAKK